MKYDLEERTAKLGELVIDLCKRVEPNWITRPLVGQLIRSATSVGANYKEANEASSRRDFRNKISICAKECNETKHWLRMISRATPKLVNDCRGLWQEAHELTLIFATIVRKMDSPKPMGIEH